MKNFIDNYLKELRDCIESIPPKDFEKTKTLLLEARNNGRKIFIIGNGGSATTASHAACDLSKGVLGHTGEKKIKRFKIISLADSNATTTAWANDTTFDNIFSEQLENLMDADDILVAISASGNSKNILNAVKTAKSHKAKIIGLAGFDGGILAKESDITLIAPIKKYDVAEDIHLILFHMLTRWFFENL